MQTFKVIHAQERESVAVSIGKLVLLIALVSVALTAMVYGGTKTYQCVQVYSAQAYSGPLDGVWDVLADIWFCAKVLFWLFVALIVSGIVALFTISTGLVAWACKWVVVGFINAFNGLSSMAAGVKDKLGSVSLPSISTVRHGVEIATVVIGAINGKPVTLKDFATTVWGELARLKTDVYGKDDSSGK